MSADRKSSAKAEPPSSKPASKQEPERNEFLILAAGEGLKVGSTVRIVAVAETRAKAEKALESLEPAQAGRVALVEKKGLFSCKPAVVVTPVSGNIVHA